HAYANANPVVNSDPTGHYVQCAPLAPAPPVAAACVGGTTAWLVGGAVIVGGSAVVGWVGSTFFGRSSTPSQPAIPRYDYLGSPRTYTQSQINDVVRYENTRQDARRAEEARSARD